MLIAPVLSHWYLGAVECPFLSLLCSMFEVVVQPSSDLPPINICRAGPVT
jgi:hypothetical protein